MKKVLGWLILATLVFTIGLGSGVPTTVQAKTRSTVKTFPKRYRRTWYHYDGKGKYERVHFTSKQQQVTYYLDGKKRHDTEYLHARKLNSDPDKAQIHNTWVVGVNMKVRHAHWINLRGWNQSAGAGDDYKVTTKTYHGKKYRVLTHAGGAGLWVMDHYYPSKKVAKKLGNHHFKGEVYGA